MEIEQIYSWLQELHDKYPPFNPLIWIPPSTMVLKKELKLNGSTYRFYAFYNSIIVSRDSAKVDVINENSLGQYLMTF